MDEVTRMALEQAWDQGRAAQDEDLNPFTPRETIEIDSTWEEIV